LSQCAAGELVARDAVGKAQIVFDPRRRSRLAAGRLALDDQCHESLGCAIHGGREAGWPAADDHGVVFGGARDGLQSETLRDFARFGVDECRAVGEAQCRPFAFTRARCWPTRGQRRVVGQHPVERHLVARKKPAQIVASRVPLVPDDGHLRLRRLRGEALQAPDTFACECADCVGNLRRHGGNLVVLPRIDSNDARRFRRTIAADERPPECERYFAEYFAWETPADRALDAFDPLTDFDLARQDSEESSILALVNRVLSCGEAKVRGSLCKVLELDSRQLREQRNACEFLYRQHGARLTERPGHRTATLKSAVAPESAVEYQVYQSVELSVDPVSYHVKLLVILTDDRQVAKRIRTSSDRPLLGQPIESLHFSGRQMTGDLIRRRRP
jgi:hypothetical protein